MIDKLQERIAKLEGENEQLKAALKNDMTQATAVVS